MCGSRISAPTCAVRALGAKDQMAGGGRVKKGQGVQLGYRRAPDPETGVAQQRERMRWESSEVGTTVKVGA